jgi:uncharacterized protein YjiS (DUF1127 family)
MISTALSRRAEVLSLSLVMGALKGFRRMRLRAAQPKPLLGLDDYLLRDMGLTRVDALYGKF